MQLPARLEQGEIESGTKLRPGKWRADALSCRPGLRRAVWGEIGERWKASVVGTESAQHRLSRDCPREGGEKAAENQFLQAGPRDGRWGRWLINAAWSPAGTGLGVTLKSKHTQPNE